MQLHFSHLIRPSLLVWAVAVTLTACGDDAKLSGSEAAGAGGQTTSSTAGSGPVGTAGAGTVAGASSSVSEGAPEGFALAEGLQLGAVTKCDEMLTTSCSGACVSKTAESNRCQAVAVARIFTQLARDAQGIYFSIQGSVNSTIAQLDATGSLVTLASPPGDNKHVRLALGEGLIYFEYDRVLYSMPRAGGSITEVLRDLPNTEAIAVVGQRLFVDVSLATELDEFDLVQGTKIVHTRDVSSVVNDGTDLYFVQADGLYRADHGQIDAVAKLTAGPVSRVLGALGDWVYVVSGQDADRAVRRFPKVGGDGEVIQTLGATAQAGLTNDSVVFTHKDATRQYVSTVTLDGKRRTILGYLPLSGVSILTGDANFVYTVIGFNLVKFRR